MATEMSSARDEPTAQPPGDEAARRELLERHREHLRHMVELRLDRRVAPRIDPSDIVQETLIIADRRLDTYLAARPLPFLAWLRQIAAERIIDAHRRHLHARRRSVAREDRASGRSTGTGLDLADANPTPGTDLVRRERLEKVTQAMATLSPRDRELLLMRHSDQYSAAAIAEALGISVGAVEVGLYRALLRLKGRIEAEP